MRVSLATTALTDYWGDAEELIFLGPWCLTPESERAAATRPATQLPCPWDDPDQIEAARGVLDPTYESTLKALSEYLDGVHSIRRSRLYWRIVLGPWLLQHLHPLYDRYAHLTRALRLRRAWDTIVMPASSWRTPHSTQEAADLVTDDPYNLQLYSQVLASLGERFPERPFVWSERVEGAHRRFLLRMRSEARELRARRGRGPWPSAVLVDMYARPETIRRLAASAGFGVRETPRLRRVEAVFDAKRLGLADVLEDRDDFESLLSTTLPYALPTVFLEGYAEASSRMERLVRNVDVVGSATGWFFQDPFKLAAAAAHEAGARLIATQHGGGYGMARWFPAEGHEATISDTYFVWGWGDHESGQENLPSLKLAAAMETSGASRRARSGDVPRLLLVTTSHPRYLYRFHSTPLAAQWERYVAWQQRFLRALDAAAREHLVIRLGSPDFGRDQRAPLEAVIAGLRYDRYPGLYRSMGRSACVVVDHCLTSCLEALYMDVPTILFWDEDLWPLRAAAEPYLALLRDAGIFHATPEGAAEMINRSGPDYATWWNLPAVREARRAFVGRYALDGPEPIQAWVARLRAELRRGHEPVGE